MKKEKDIRKIAYNRYDILLYLMVALIALGTVGGFFQPVRLLHLALLPMMAYELWQSRTWMKQYLYPLLFLLIWWVYAAIGLYWNKTGMDGYKYFVHLSIYMLSFVEILWLSRRAKDAGLCVCLGWASVVALTFPIALFEFISDIHLPTCYHSSGMVIFYSMGEFIPRAFAAATFDNLNTYNTVICYALPCLAYLTADSRRYLRNTGYILLAASIVILLSNNSRSAFIVLVLVLLFMCVFVRAYSRKYEWINIGIATFVILWLGLGLMHVNTPSFNQLQAIRLSRSGGLEQDADSPTNGLVARLEMQQDAARTAILKAGVQEIKRTYGLGVGTGNNTYVLKQHSEIRFFAPHNLLLEVSMQFGLLIGIAFILFVLYPLQYYRALSKRRRYILLLSLGIAVPLSIMDSTFLLKAQTWAYIASLYILVQPAIKHK